MATTKLATANGVYDLSVIKSVKELREEINLLKASIKKDEKDLSERLQKFPQHVMKASADAVLPSFINKMIANGSWKVLTAGAGMLVNPFSKKVGFGKKILGSAKKLGMLAVLKGAYNIWRNKQTEKPIKATTLKTVKPALKSVPPKSIK